MVNVIGVRFENAGKLYFFDPGQFWPTPGDYVLVETSRGIEFGEVVTGIKEIDDAMLQSPLKPVVRIASAEDLQHFKDNKAAEKEAYQVCQKKISEHKLDMKLVSVEYTFDNSKILFYFTANGRVDFRSLVKDLASVFKTRIELRQIGVRDEAKMLGGIGPCGRPICCRTFLGDFTPVSIKMAKEQNLSLNPTKISGLCDRLMCCLKYEQDQYEATRKRMPRVGREIITPDGVGTINAINVLEETVRVRIAVGDSFELRQYKIDDCQRPEPQNAPQHERADKGEKQEKAERSEKPEKKERAEQPERAEKAEKPEKGEKQDKNERREKQDKPRREGDKPKRERSEKPERPEKGEKADKPERGERREKRSGDKRPQKPQGDRQEARAEVREKPAAAPKETAPVGEEDVLLIVENTASEDLL